MLQLSLDISAYVDRITVKTTYLERYQALNRRYYGYSIVSTWGDNVVTPANNFKGDRSQRVIDKTYSNFYQDTYLPAVYRLWHKNGINNWEEHYDLAYMS